MSLTFLLFVACAGSQKADSTPLEIPAFDKGEVWQLVAINGKPLTYHPAPTLIFNPETGLIHGTMACNTYFGLYSCHPGDPKTARYPIKITLQGAGTLTCHEALINADNRYYALLPKTTHLAYSPTSITLYQQNKEILRYELR